MRLAWCRLMCRIFGHVRSNDPIERMFNWCARCGETIGES